MDDASNLDHVRQVLEQHREEILARYHAVGVGIGKFNLSDPGYVITVYLESASDRPTAPGSIEDVPLKFEVTGTFKPLK